MSLPIYDAELEFHQALVQGNRIILEAPTGSGKSTQIPQMLLKSSCFESGEAIVLQPRRIAARMLARRVAFEIGEKLGERVGYQIRHENVSSRKTRIRFVTEGILLRRMIADPELKGVSALVFDEFHERSIYADLTLARALTMQKTVRPDLKIIVMSATLDTGSLQNFLEPCQVVSAKGRMYPVDLRYVENRELRSDEPVWDRAARQVARLVEEEKEGHVLVFMPGAFEIGRTIQSIGRLVSNADFELLPLHGELSPKDQDRALDRAGRRKIIVSTNVAETSLTIDNVRIVVDSGQARIARYDPVRGINTLWIEKISDASAKQRMGRAGRTAPGICVRLWTPRDHEHRARYETPEILRVDLAETLLSLKASGIENLDTFEWFEPPSGDRLKDALDLLSQLGAIDENRVLTARGKRLSAFPMHPRYAAIMLAAEELSCVEEMAAITAIAQSRGLFLRKVDKGVERARSRLPGSYGECDFVAQLGAWEAARSNGYRMDFCNEFGIHAQTARQVERAAEQILQYSQSKVNSGDAAPVDDTVLRKSLLYGFPDRVCRRLDRGTYRCAVTGGRRGMLSRDSRAGEAELFVACEASELGKQSGEVTTVLSSCSRIERTWLEELFPKAFSSGEETVFDEKLKRVVFRKYARFLDLDLECSENLDCDLDKAAAVLASLVLDGKAKLSRWDEAVETLIIRANLIAQAFPEYEIDPIDDEARELLVEQCCHGARSLKDLKRKEVLPVIENWIGREVLDILDREAPLKVRLPSGRSGKIQYTSGSKPVFAAKIQDFYDLEGGIEICQGRIKPLIQMLAPNMRPVQITESLERFWTDSYPAIKKELKGRYPKHEWR